MRRSSRVGPYRDAEGRQHLLILDGYAASAEALQAASLDPVLGTCTSMCMFSPRLRGRRGSASAPSCGSTPTTPRWSSGWPPCSGATCTPADLEAYRGALRHARRADLPVQRRTLTADDFFPQKEWDGLALAGFMLPDPYTGSPGVEEVGEGVYRVTTLAGSARGVLRVTLTLRLIESKTESRLVFSPLLDRFFAGQDYRTRPVKISDSGRIRNELQTWCSEALEYLDEDAIRVHLDSVDDAVLSPEKRAFIREVLLWYKANHPIWFRWLEVGQGRVGEIVMRGDTNDSRQNRTATSAERPEEA